MSAARRVLAGLLLAPLIGCGGANTPLPVSPPTGVSGPLSLAGRIVSNPDGQPVAGAALTLSPVSQPAQVTLVSDADGRFSLPGVPPGLIPFTLSAPAAIIYSSRLSLGQSNGSIELRLIRDAPPFALEFYRQFARNGLESEFLQPLRRWTRAPRFYIRARIEETGEPVPALVLSGVERLLRASVPPLSGGLFQVAEIAIGSDARPATAGWVNVTFHHQLPNNIGGQASVGGDEGIIRLRYDGARDAEPSRGCEAATISYMDHEIVHTMGYWHTGGAWGSQAADFLSEDCSGSRRGSRALHHAAIVYSRPPGNQDPDRDPVSFTLPQTAGTGRGPVVSCDLTPPPSIR